MMTSEIYKLLPLILLAGGALVVLLSIAFHRRRCLAASLAIVFLIAAFASLFVVASSRQTAIDGLLTMDNHARYFIGLLIFAAVVTALLSAMYQPAKEEAAEEFYCLLLLATLGGAILASSTHGATLLLGLEMLSISLYAMIAYVRTRVVALEAAFKYLVLAATSSAFLIFGLALLYAASGSFALADWNLAVQHDFGPLPALCFSLGVVFVMVGAGFKLAVVPFHMWAPDIYQASPEPVAAFITTASKGGMIAFFLRFAVETNAFVNNEILVPVLVIIAVLSMLVGNLLALLQNNLKRLLAYSSIAHMGYLLVAIRVAGSGASSGTIATGYYLAAYFPAMLAAFGVLTVLTQEAGREIATLEDLRGLVHERPFYAAVLTVALLSLAGLPLTAGFMGKLYIVIGGVESNAWVLVSALVIGTTIGIYYYLRVISVIFAARVPATASLSINATSPVSSSLQPTALLTVLVILIVWLGVQPVSLLELLAASAPF